ncbi:hypothetical protein ACU4HD_09235 [Cupriavidus basilensis]
MTRIIITHISGSKAHQIEQFEVDRFDQIILGRDPAATVVFDPQRDDLVSRQHACNSNQERRTPSLYAGRPGQ